MTYIEAVLPVYATTSVNHIDPIYLNLPLSIVFVTFHFYLKVSLKNIKRVILHVHGIFVLPYFLQVFSISASRSDSEPQQASLLWLYNSININIFVLYKFPRWLTWHHFLILVNQKAILKWVRLLDHKEKCTRISFEIL